jgi:cell division protein FtsL
MKRSHILLALLGICIIVLSVAQISVSNMLSTGGIQLSNMQQQISNYDRKNAQLKEQIYSLSSLTAISEKAQKLGFVDNQTAVVITDHAAPIALKP